MAKLSEKKLLEIAKKIKLLILDVDGVLTDGSIILDNKGNELKAFHVRDGHGIKMLSKQGIHVAIITGRYSRVVEKRARELHIQDVFQKSHDKRIPYRQLVEKYSLRDSEIAYVGDDIVDIPLLKVCGLPVAVADAHDMLKEVVKMTTREKGGRGAVRELCDFLLKAKGLWKDIMNEYA
jgi:3-deoxy-D-manno-octulosonate 8-phosphate phosphatase (KDO 8-P phosphatase)